MLKRVLAIVLVALLALDTMAVLAQEGDSAVKAVEYLQTMQNEDGGFGTGWTPESDLVTTADVVVAMVAAERSGESLDAAVIYLETQVGEGNVATAGEIAKVITAVVAVGGDPADFAGHNLPEDLLEAQGEGSVFGDGAFHHCLALIALQNASVDRPEGAVEALVMAQGEDGGWGFMAGMDSDTNTTGLCLQALALEDADVVADSAAAGFDYLAGIQNEDGGWPYQNPSEYGTDSDTNSTALVVQALIAYGEDLEAWNNPQEWLLTMQNENGAFGFQAMMPDDNLVATVAVVPALAGVPLNAWAATPERVMHF